MKKILTVGGGSWGTSFSNYLTQKFSEVRIWVRETEVIESINKIHENKIFLPEIKLSKKLIPVSDLKKNILDSEIIILAVPSKFMRSVLGSIKEEIKDKIIVNLSKGFESDSLKTISQIAVDVLGKDVLNNWITLNHPTAVSSVSSNNDILKEIQELFSSEVLRMYRSDDLIGVEVAGSMKNVMAIASGNDNKSYNGDNEIRA